MPTSFGRHPSTILPVSGSAKPQLLDGSRTRSFKLVLLLVSVLAPFAWTQTSVAAIGVGSGPSASAVNPATNKVYVANNGGTTVTVIDGATNTTTTVNVGSAPGAIAVNPVTNKIYVANSGSGDVTVIDGATNTTSTVTVGSTPSAIAVNPATNKIYVANEFGGGVTVIDGVTNSTASVTAGSVPYAIGVNPATNKIYVANYLGSSVTVIDGATNSTATVSTGTRPAAIAVDVVTNKIYVANAGSASVTVIDGATNSTATVGVGSEPYAIALNSATNKFYVANSLTDNVTVIDGVTHATATLGVGSSPSAIAVDSLTNKIYVANGLSDNATVIDGGSLATATVGTGTNPSGISLNPVTGRVYVSNYGAGNVTVIDEDVNATATVTAANGPIAVDLNPATNKVYVANTGSDSVTRIDGATNATTTINVGTGPNAVATNPVTDKIYVANGAGDNVTVIDGATNATTPVGAGTGPNAVAVNPVTNKIYVTNATSNNVTVIDGASNATLTVAAGTGPSAVAANPATNRIYVTNASSGDVTVIDGASNATATVGVGTTPVAVAVNTATNSIYVANQGSGDVTVIDGATNSTATVGAGTDPSSVAINPTTNKIYVANRGSGNVTVIDGATNATATVNVGNHPVSVTVNPVTNEVYVANANSGNVTVIDGATNTTSIIPAGTTPSAVVVNTATNKAYVANQGSGNVTVISPSVVQSVPLAATLQGTVDAQTIAGNAIFSTSSSVPSFSSTVTSSYTPTAPPPTTLYYQLDSALGEWKAATETSGAGSNPASYSFSLSGVSMGVHTVFVYAVYGDEGTSGSSTYSGAGSLVIGNLAAYTFVVLQQPTTTTLSSDVNPQNQGQSVTFTALVAPTSGGGIPGGVVQFLDGASPIGTATLDGTGHAVLATSSLTAASHAISAVYEGNATYAASASNALNEVIAGAPAAITVYSGAGQTAQISVAFTNPLVAAVTDSNSNPVPNATVTFTGTGLTFSGGGTASTDSNGRASITATPTVSGSLTASASVTGVVTPATFALTATGDPSGLALSKSSMVWDAQGVGQTSAGPYFYETVSNHSGAPVSLSGIGPVGDFGVTGNGCTAILANNSSCTFYVTFTPSSTGVKTATMNIVGLGRTLPLALTGTGVPSVASLYRSVIGWGSQGVGVTSTAVYTALSNFTGSTVSVSGIGPVGDFGVVNNTCGATLATNATCYFFVNFTPTATGVRTATMNILAGSTSLPLSLSGTGVPSVVSLSRNVIAFGNQGTSLASASVSVTIFNYTGSGVALSGITPPSADFGVTANTCAATLAATARCSFSVTFTPSSTGAKSATMNIVAGSTSLPLSLTGTGVPSVVSLSQNAMIWNAQGVGQTSVGPYYYETVSNYSGSAVSLGGIAGSGDFSITGNGCGSTLANNSACTFYVTFTPSSTGVKTATINIVAGSTTLPLALTGTGVPSVVSLYRPVIGWGSQTVGVTSGVVYNALSNFSGGTVSLSGIGPVGEFGVVNNTCGATLANNATCYFFVNFTPTATGTRSATMNIVAGSTTLPLSLSGFGK